MRFQLIPEKQGQICRSVENENFDHDSIYILITAVVDRSSAVDVVSIADLQTNLLNPDNAPRQRFNVDSLTVVADSFEKYVASWNNETPPVRLKAYIISNLDDVRQVFTDLHKILPDNILPDGDFSKICDDKSLPLFSDLEVRYLNQVLTVCFQTCKYLDADIDDLAGNIQVQGWKQRGI